MRVPGPSVMVAEVVAGGGMVPSMRVHWHRVALAFFLAGTALIGFSVFLTSTEAQTSSASSETHTIIITDRGVNPAHCVHRRDDRVRWENRSTGVRRIIIPSDADGLNPPLFDSGDFAPGAISNAVTIPFLLNGKQYHDFYNRALAGQLSTTLYAASCKEQPPTPTPTNTPTPAPIRPTPVPLIRPLFCRSVAVEGCAVVPSLSRDDAE